ncbi:hypothetical protein O6P37_19935 [Mycobacterium sp. CPCC 205372]|uniref:Uncharacterized protein n=1 Tax=Mycobacterium hippophais TaxID=3016340 RepID=A0ABT4PXF9_9MYCO|nr:hypothetical protein [Mycobacterium hippophais]MCZ8381144.1 hypothetical protein [Mycobacterium hippophais]
MLVIEAVVTGFSCALVGMSLRSVRAVPVRKKGQSVQALIGWTDQ